MYEPKARRKCRNVWADIIDDELKELTLMTPDKRSPNFHRLEPLISNKSLFGLFQCNTNCPRTWGSGNITVQMEYMYNEETQRGEIKLFESGQKCQRCKGSYERPKFSHEQLQLAANHLKAKILEKFYGVKKREQRSNTNKRPPRWNHDARHCQACHLGVCSFAQSGLRLYRNSNNKKSYTDRYQEREDNSIPNKINWQLMYVGDVWENH